MTMGSIEPADPAPAFFLVARAAVEALSSLGGAGVDCRSSGPEAARIRVS
jgi:hypothetical protein